MGTQAYNFSGFSLIDAASGVVSNAALDATLLHNPSLQHGLRMTLIKDSDLPALECEWNRDSYCAWNARELLTEYFEWQIGPQDWHAETFLKDSSGAYLSFTPPLRPRFTVPADTDKYGDYAGSTQTLHYQGHGQLHVPHKCFSRTTNDETDCSHATRNVPALSIPYGDDGKVTLEDGSVKWVKWLEKEIRFERDASATAASKGITFGDASSLPATPTLSGDAEDPYDRTTAKYAGVWPAALFETAPSVVHGELQ